MYKVMIVDDEILVRVGLKSTIDWESLGFTVIAEASNGEQAYEAYKLHRPDVVLTDIRMPKKDGLWLTEIIKKESPRTKVLILTCYDDFSYAREALKLGAANYILKSEVEDEELINIMGDIRKSLDNETKKLEKDSYLQIQINSNLATLKEKLLQDLIKSNLKVNEELYLRCSELNFDIRDKQFLSVIMLRDDAGRSMPVYDMNWQLMNFAIMNIAAEIFNENSLNHLSISEDDRYTILLNKDQLSEKEIMPVLNRIKDSVNQYLNMPLSIVVSQKFIDIRLVGAMVESCLKKAQFMFYYDGSSIIQVDNREFKEINIVKAKKHFEQILLNYLEEENIQKALDEIDQLEAYFKQNLYTPFEVRMFYSNMVSSVLEYYNNCFSSEEEPQDYSGTYNLIMKADRIKDITGRIKELLLSMVKDMEKYRIKHSNNIIRKAIDYINKHYGEDISLQALADHLNLSKHYVCYLFKKETGENISHYVNQVRIEKAKHLLLESDYKIKEIYDQLGFSDQQYFSKIFKKITGMTVVQYRDSVLKRNKSS